MERRPSWKSAGDDFDRRADEGKIKMSVLTHGFDPALDRVTRSKGISNAGIAQFKRVGLQVLTLLSMGSVLTALIALKTAIQIWHMHV